MENKKELFDLQREKRELDAFLSTFKETDASFPPENMVQPREPVSFSAESKLELESASQEISGLEMETPALKPEEVPEPAEIKLELESASREISGLEMETSAPKPEEAPEPAEIKLELESASQEISGLEMETSAPEPEEAPEPAEIKLELESASREISGLEMETPAPEPEEAPEPAEIKLELESASQEISGLEMEAPAPKFEEMREEPREEPDQAEKMLVTDDQEMRSGLTDTIAIKPPEMPVEEREPEPSFAPFEEEKTEIPPERTDTPGAQPPENVDAMTRFDETTQYDESASSITPPLDEEIKSPKPVPEKKKSKTNAYDFAPEKQSTGIGKWLWIGISIILLVALFAGYFLFIPEQGGKVLDAVKSYLPFSKTEQSIAPAAVQGINLIQVRQKLIHNEKLGKEIRVLEGIIENSTDHPVSKIKIAARLYNAEGAVLASTESFGGNIIIDEKLESLDADGILAALKDVKTMEDRVQPKGQIPFMIVFTSVPSGVFRLTALPVDLKRH